MICVALLEVFRHFLSDLGLGFESGNIYGLLSIWIGVGSGIWKVLYLLAN
jgi:hypothetical protein